MSEAHGERGTTRRLGEGPDNEQRQTEQRQMLTPLRSEGRDASGNDDGPVATPGSGVQDRTRMRVGPGATWQQGQVDGGQLSLPSVSYQQHQMMPTGAGAPSFPGYTQSPWNQGFGGFGNYGGPMGAQGHGWYDSGYNAGYTDNTGPPGQQVRASARGARYFLGCIPARSSGQRAGARRTGPAQAKKTRRGERTRSVLHCVAQPVP